MGRKTRTSLDASRSSDDKIFRFVYLIGLVTGSVIRARYTKGMRNDSITEDRRTVADTILLAIATIGMAPLPFTYLMSSRLDRANYRLPRVLHKLCGIVGTLTYVASLIMLWRSHADLGRNWTPTLQIKSDHDLITNGVYRRIRHPMYAAHILWAIAQALLLRNWIAGPSMLVSTTPLYIYRMPREERMMLEVFGDGYRNYMARTGRVIPKAGA